jgi:hypothetical protein
MENIVKETVTQNSPAGSATVSKVSSTDTNTQTIASIIYFIFGLFEILLGFRLILKMTGANPGSGFVSGIYSFTQLLILPFRGIFSSAVSTGLEVKAIFEPATLVAMVVYALVAWGLVKLIAILAGHSNEEL